MNIELDEFNMEVIEHCFNYIEEKSNSCIYQLICIRDRISDRNFDYILNRLCDLLDKISHGKSNLITMIAYMLKIKYSYVHALTLIGHSKTLQDKLEAGRLSGNIEFQNLVRNYVNLIDPKGCS